MNIGGKCLFALCFCVLSAFSSPSVGLEPIRFPLKPLKSQEATLLGLFLRAKRPTWCTKQGIEGYLYRVSGNQMPSPDVKPSPPSGIKGSLYIYELTNISQVVREQGSSFYSAVNARFIKKVETNSKGYFKIKLQPGKYSLFTKKDSLFFANRFDSENNIAPVEVLPKKLTRVEVRIDYDAVY